MKQRNWIWVVIFAAIFAGCLALWLLPRGGGETVLVDRKSTRLNSSHTS